MSSPYKFKIGSIVKSKNGKHQEVPPDEKYEIIEIDKCTHACTYCEGNPIIRVNGQKVHLCGYGPPWDNFEVQTSQNELENELENVLWKETKRIKDMGGR